MKLEIEVRRVRGSVTQGGAAVYVNGEEVIQFGDRIEFIKDGQPYYGEMIGGWASVKPDADFIKGLLWHPYDEVYHYSDRVRKILDAEGQDAGECYADNRELPVVTTTGIEDEIDLREGFSDFLEESLRRFKALDWGVIDPADAEHNNENPAAAIGAYEYEGEVKVYIKAEDGKLWVFLPEDC